MSDNNQFQPYRYNQQRDIPPPPYDRPGLNISAAERLSAGKPRGIFSVLQNPVVGTAALILTAAVFVGVLMVGYGGGDSEGDVPIVQADATSVKSMPDAPGGIEIPYQDSSIFQAADNTGARPVESLLDQEEEPVSKLEAFAEQAQAMMDETPADMAEATPSETVEAVEKESEAIRGDAVEADMVVADGPPMEELEAPVIAEEQAASSEISEAATAEAPDVYAAGSSPETLDFVRSVLDKKDAKVEAGDVPSSADVHEMAGTVEDEATAVSSVQPAAGIIPPEAIQSGTYYVQLASITSETAAPKEWSKLEKSYASLSGLDYRVNRADLGERGVYYRIQAGPMSKDSAERVCSSIKAQKPGACLVTK